ncbi:MAG TPA: hypothetical protein VKO62_04745 [Solirubrobacterales bacterium]|nr:hypothetical protein [Solirubrobacterales bacterium]
MALLAVPIVVAALIGFGTSLSGVVGGLSSLTSGPDAVPPSARTAPRSLTHAVATLASKQNGSGGPAPADNRVGGSNTTTLYTGTGGGSAGSAGGTTGTSTPTISTPSAPSVSLPAGGSTGGATDTVNDTVNNVVGGVGDTVNGLLGK